MYSQVYLNFKNELRLFLSEFKPLRLIGLTVRTGINGLNQQILIKIYLKHYKTCNTLENTSLVIMRIIIKIFRCRLKNMSGVHGFPSCHVGTNLFSLFSLLCPFSICLSLSVFLLFVSMYLHVTSCSSFSKIAYEIEIKLFFKKF